MLLVKMIRWADNPPLLIDRLKLRKFLFAGAFLCHPSPIPEKISQQYF